MSHRKERYHHFNVPHDAYGNLDPRVVPYTGTYAEPYLTHGYHYYNTPTYAPQVRTYSNVTHQVGAYSNVGYWSDNSAYNAPYAASYSSSKNSTPVPHSYVRKKTIFSPNAPEFVSRSTAPKVDTPANIFIQQSSGNVEENSDVCGKKKKKRKPKKKKKIVEEVDTASQVKSSEETSEKVLKVTSILVRNPAEKNIESKAIKSVQFQAEAENLHDDHEHNTHSVIPVKPANYSSLFRKPVTKKTGEKEEVAWPNLPLPNVDGPSNRKKIDDHGSSSLQKVLSFADKLKGRTAPIKSPFLDWRDQRTTGTNVTHYAAKAKEVIGQNHPKETSSILTKTTLPTASVPATNSAKSSELSSSNDGFIEIRRRKAKEKKSEISLDSVTLEKSKDTTTALTAAKQAEKEKKKLREKEKKKRIREDKILAEKLGPKNQKISFITPKVMEKFLQNTSTTKSTQPILNLDENFFPSLHKTNSYASGDSESEWETTEVIIPKPPPAAVTQPVTRNVKRSSRIEFDLMALINKKTNKKASVAKADRKVRTGVVANVLDRSAPVLSRGKVRNKKRKLSEIRKALLVAKAKRKLQSLPGAGGQNRPHQLHSKKFREYCDQVLTDEIDVLARDMLYHLCNFQDRAFKENPIKGRMKKRLVAGLREVTKQVERNRIKIIMLSPDIQRCPETGGLDEAVKNLLDAARKNDLPIVYALSRRKMGRVLRKKVPVSCCGIFNYQATEETWKKLLLAVTAAREEYQIKVKQLGINPEVDTGKNSPTVLLLDDVSQPDPVVEAPETKALLDLMKLSLKEG